MKLPGFLLTLVLSYGASSLHADDTFHVYAPSRESNTLWIISATPSEDNIDLKTVEKVDLGFSAATITAHPEKPLLYLASNRSEENGVTPGAAIRLDEGGKKSEIIPFPLIHGYSYISLDRKNRFLLGANYSNGNVDVYALSEDDVPWKTVAKLDEGRKNAHCVLTSPDNRSIYIPYVKDTNALYQYSFESETGKISPLKPLNANPPEGTGPRHLAYHPSLPVLYFSNEQSLGVSAYRRAESGHLTLLQVCDITGQEAPAEGVSSSDIVITPDGKYLFAGIRGHKHDFDWISRYGIMEDGKIKHLGLTPADKIPWGLALSPDGKYLLATGFEAGTLMAYQIEDGGNLKRVGTLQWDKKISDLITR
ncbi:MAG: hypothetical protein CMO55_24025 [Verrucomicrobiales bacterium]|nr:hypothetical protein [Verrucomicrobiales bacterium]